MVLSNEALKSEPDVSTELSVVALEKKVVEVVAVLSDLVNDLYLGL